MEHVSPCLTCARAVSGGFWVSTYGRRFQAPEMCILQGMPADRLTYKGIIPESAFRKIIGNAFSLNVMERILVRAFNATHLLPQKTAGPLGGKHEGYAEGIRAKIQKWRANNPQSKNQDRKGTASKSESILWQLQADCQWPEKGRPRAEQE